MLLAVLEMELTTDQTGGCTAATVGQDRATAAGTGRLDLFKRCWNCLRIVDQRVTSTVREDHQISGYQGNRYRPIRILDQPTAATVDDVEIAL